MTLREYLRQFDKDDMIRVYFFAYDLPVDIIGSVEYIFRAANDEFINFEVDVKTEKILATGTREITLKQ